MNSGRTWVCVEFREVENLPAYKRLDRILASISPAPKLLSQNDSVAMFKWEDFDVDFALMGGSRLRIEYALNREEFIRERILEMIKEMKYEVDRIVGAYYKYRWVHPGQYRLLTEPDAPPPAFFDEAIIRDSTGSIVAIHADEFEISKNAETGRWYAHKDKSPESVEVEPASIHFDPFTGSVSYKTKALQQIDYIAKYFEGFADLSVDAKEYLQSTLSFFDNCGFIELLVQSGLYARLDDLGDKKLSKQQGKHSVFDRAQFEREIVFFKKFGALMALPSKQKPLIEVRLNLVVAHEIAHQLQILLEPNWVEQFVSFYQARIQVCAHNGSDTKSEQIMPDELGKRHFISGYARLGPWEYFAESFSCFADKTARRKLKELDSETYVLLSELFLNPEEAFKMPWKMKLITVRAYKGINKAAVLDLLDD